MSLHINFEPHSWYMGFAIGKYGQATPSVRLDIPWFAVTANGMTGYLVEFESSTLSDLKRQIKGYRSK